MRRKGQDVQRTDAPTPEEQVKPAEAGNPAAASGGPANNPTSAPTGTATGSAAGTPGGGSVKAGVSVGGGK